MTPTLLLYTYSFVVCCGSLRIITRTISNKHVYSGAVLLWILTWKLSKTFRGSFVHFSMRLAEIICSVKFKRSIVIFILYLVYILELCTHCVLDSINIISVQRCVFLIKSLTIERRTRGGGGGGREREGEGEWEDINLPLLIQLELRARNCAIAMQNSLSFPGLSHLNVTHIQYIPYQALPAISSYPDPPYMSLIYYNTTSIAPASN
jgi:hypothetical protein